MLPNLKPIVTASFLSDLAVASKKKSGCDMAGKKEDLLTWYDEREEELAFLSN